MKQHSTLFLKFALFVIGTPVLVLCVVMIVDLVKNPVGSDYDQIFYPLATGIILSTIPFYTALYQAFTLLVCIDQNQAFSELSVIALKNIKKCAVIIAVVYVILELFVYQVAQLEDAPGLVIIGMIPVFGSLVIAVFAAVLQKLLNQAITIKSENDLVV